MGVIDELLTGFVICVDHIVVLCGVGNGFAISAIPQKLEGISQDVFRRVCVSLASGVGHSLQSSESTFVACIQQFVECW